jgi:Arc/MetJ-type ribon-helix-helix transcriptional regulator
VLRIARDGIRQDLERYGSMSDPIRTALVAIEDILSNTLLSEMQHKQPESK